MKKIIKYTLVAMRHLEWFNKEVNNLIMAGYQPHGEPQITMQAGEHGEIITVYSQVMVIYEK